MSLLVTLTIKVSGILLLALVATVCLRTRSASARHWVLAIGVVSACAAPAVHVLPLPPVVQMAPVAPRAWRAPFNFDALGPRPSAPPAEAADDGAIGPTVVAPGPADSRLRQPRPPVAATGFADAIGWWAVTIWLAGLVVSAGVLLVGLARLHWFRAASSRVTEGPWHRLCSDLARSCGLRCAFDLLLGPRSGLVATWGWRRPAVMLPSSASEWSSERMRVVLLHELAHARRGDWALQMAADALRCVWWFNPLAWIVRARLRRESERAADDLVLAQGVPAGTCATHVLELAREARDHHRTWLPAPGMARPPHLELRLAAMLNAHTNRRPMTRPARFWSLVALGLASIVVASLHVSAQAASIAGKVVDSAGNAVRRPGITFTIGKTGQVSTLVGRDDGSFEIFDLKPGEYGVAVRKPGFEPLFRPFTLEAGEQREEELVLSPEPASRQPQAESEAATRFAAEAVAGGRTIGVPVLEVHFEQVQFQRDGGVLATRHGRYIIEEPTGRQRRDVMTFAGESVSEIINPETGEGFALNHDARSFVAGEWNSYLPAPDLEQPTWGGVDVVRFALGTVRCWLDIAFMALSPPSDSFRMGAEAEPIGTRRNGPLTLRGRRSDYPGGPCVEARSRESWVYEPEPHRRNGVFFPDVALEYTETLDVGGRPWVAAEQRIVAARRATMGEEIFEVPTGYVER